MLKLDFFENKFEQSSFKVKLELFLFPLIIALLLYYLLNSFENKKESKIDIGLLTKKEQKQKTKIEIIKDIENYLSKNRIKLVNISTIRDKLQIEVEENSVKLLSFLLFVEYYDDYSKIETLKIEGDSLFLSLSFNKSYIKSKNKEQSKKLEFLKEYKGFKDRYILKAIVGKTVLINDKWITLGEKIESNLVLKDIKRDSVVLKNEQIEINLRLYDEANI